jgi:hypothetical protein
MLWLYEAQNWMFSSSREPGSEPVDRDRAAGGYPSCYVPFASNAFRQAEIWLPGYVKPRFVKADLTTST